MVGEREIGNSSPDTIVILKAQAKMQLEFKEVKKRSAEEIDALR